MASATNSAAIMCVGSPLAAVDSDLLVVPWFEGEGPSVDVSLDEATGGELGRAVASKEFGGRLYELFVTPVNRAGWRARRIGFAGAGDRTAFSTDQLRKLASMVGLVAREHRAERVALALRDEIIRGRGHDSAADVAAVAAFAQAAAEGLTLSEFKVAAYKTVDPPPDQSPAWTIVLSDPEAVSHAGRAIARGRLLGECSNLARDLANEPGNRLTPREFSRRCVQITSDAGILTEVLDETQIAKLEMGLLLGVARGSSEPPRLMVFRYTPAGAPAGPVLGLVGKGITFDTGGISIKPADGMERMKDDMAGGAAVACAMRAIGLLKAPISVIGIVPATENMPGGRAMRPGDVLRSASGKTVEVVNTDAEGRLILGDGLWYARQLGATHLVDIATLTGACVVALGKITSGLFGTPMPWVEHVRHVADRAGDRAWPMPLFDEYREQLKSDIADMMNTGGRPASAITAALFLKEFTGGLPWVHMDIAGTAWAEEAKPYLPKGPTGVGVRTLAELAFTAQMWSQIT
jgi:leucyl aminopeptidase